MQRLAMIGLGSWGRRLIDSVQGKSDDVHFTHAVVRRPDASTDFATRHGLALTTDMASVLSDPDIDGVVSCGPANLHASHSLAALRAGKPVLAVKPMALSRKDADDLAKAADASGKLLALGYNRCFFPNVIEMRKRLAAGEIGKLVHAEGNFCVDRYRSIKAGQWKGDPTNAPPGGLADHMLYLTIDTLGPLADVRAAAFTQHSDNALADVTAVLIRTQGQQTALLTAIGVTPDYYRFTVFGTEGWIELRDDTQLIQRLRDGSSETVQFDPIDAERAEVEAFAAAIAGRSPFPVPMRDAVHGVSALEAIAAAARTGQIVEL